MKMNPAHAANRAKARSFAPKLAELAETLVFGDIWERPGLSKRDRSLITMAAMVAMGRHKQLRTHMHLGIENGITKDEIAELITHLAFYAGFPCSMAAAMEAADTFQT